MASNAETMKKKYGDDYFKELGRRGGQAGKSGTFAKRPDLAKEAAVLGGFNHALPKIDCKHDQWPQEPFEHEGVDYYRCSNCRMVRRR